MRERKREVSEPWNSRCPSHEPSTSAGTHNATVTSTARSSRPPTPKLATATRSSTRKQAIIEARETWAPRSVPRKILAHDVVGGKTLSNRRVLIDAGPKGTPDGFRVDVDGNLWCGWGMGEAGLDGVHVFNPDGKLIGRIELPARCANVCFGGAHRNRLFMAATTSLYALYVNTQGVANG